MNLDCPIKNSLNWQSELVKVRILNHGIFVKIYKSHMFPIYTLRRP